MYYSYTHFDIQHWIEVSAECDVPAALTPPLPTTTLEQKSYISVDREAGRSTTSAWRIWKKERSCVPKWY
jgi:hypothetical protein